MQLVVAQAADVGQALSTRVKGRDLQLRKRFVMRTSASRTDPPLARMLRGGRGGQVRAKLLLSLLWTGVGEGHTVVFPARAWAELLGLPDPDGNGARRIRDSLGWLAEAGFILLEHVDGQPSIVTLLEETGLQKAYTVPGMAARRAKDAEHPRALGRHLYVKVPPTLWTRGWMPILTGPGLAMLLVLLVEESGRPDRELWFSPQAADDRYALSDDTRQRGLKQLADLGLITVGRRRVNQTTFEFHRFRNTYRLHLDVLGEAPPLDSKRKA